MAKTVEGLDKLNARLKAMPAETIRQVSAAVEKGAERMVAQAQRFAPVDTGETRDSIKWEWSGAGSDTGQGEASASRVAVKGGQKLAATVTAGNAKAFAVRWIEHGTVTTPAQAFFWPAWRLVRKPIRAAIARALNKAIKSGAGK